MQERLMIDVPHHLSRKLFLQNLRNLFSAGRHEIVASRLPQSIFLLKLSSDSNRNIFKYFPVLVG